jgi:hypothetical protein
MKGRKDLKRKLDLKWRRRKKAAPEDLESWRGVIRTVAGVFEDDMYEWIGEAVAKGVDRVLEEFAGEGDVIVDPSGEIYLRLDDIVSEILFDHIDRVVGDSDYVAMIFGEPGEGRRECYLMSREEFGETMLDNALEEAYDYLRERLRGYDYRTE